MHKCMYYFKFTCSYVYVFTTFHKCTDVHDQYNFLCWRQEYFTYSHVHACISVRITQIHTFTCVYVHEYMCVCYIILCSWIHRFTDVYDQNNFLCWRQEYFTYSHVHTCISVRITQIHTFTCAYVHEYMCVCYIILCSWIHRFTDVYDQYNFLCWRQEYFTYAHVHTCISVRVTQIHAFTCAYVYEYMCVCYIMLCSRIHRFIYV